MINSEQAIEKVLAGLRETEAPLGMERRILDAVEERTAARMAAIPRWAWRATLAGTIAACLFIGITAIYRYEHLSAQAHYPAFPVGSLSAKGSAISTQESSMLPTESIAQTGAAAPMRIVRRISAADAVLLREMCAPSHPAPAAPLTKEEKLLLRAVHTGNPQVMAMLNPEVRAREEAESEAEFQKFVEQSANGDSD